MPFFVGFGDLVVLKNYKRQENGGGVDPLPLSKCNVDAFRDSLNVTGMGAYTRDDKGRVAAVRTDFVNPCLQVPEGEA
ncbi:hypothetical protein JHK85_028447 [Glycine max]|nr:hypothetical protein JHK85_028447 [Glycine max]